MGTLTKKQKTAAFWGKAAAAPALFLLTLGAGSLTAYAATPYDLYIGSTQVTSDNAGNIFGTNGADGNPTAWYEPDTKTLHLNGVTIGADNYYEYLDSRYSRESNAVNRYSLYAGTDAVKHLVITGENSFESAMADVLYTFDAAEIDEGYWAVDVTGDGKITLDDATVKTETGDNGIYFSVSGPQTGLLWTDYSLMITGTGTLTSKATTPTPPDKCRVYDVYGFDSHDVVPVPPDNTVNTGTAMTVEGGGGIYMGNTDGTGPTLKLTAWDVGADFRSGGRFAMQGGTVIAKAASSTKGTGVYLPSKNFFEGGTIAGYGIYNSSDPNSGAFSNQYGKFDTQISIDHGMQRVYPATVGTSTSTTKINGISDWGVVGMTADGFKEQTDTVMETLRTEYGLDASGGGEGPGTDPVNPGTDPTNPDTPGGGEGVLRGGSHHTDTVTDPSVEIDVQGYTTAATVYSVDVEWGAMTFQYETGSWDPENHVAIAGRGWLVYDNTTDTILGKAAETQDAINQIKVTNHSNAEVFATLSYTGTDSYTGITGGFTKKADDTGTDFTDATSGLPAYLTLGTANSNPGGTGQATEGNAYFMPTTDTAMDIPSWTKIGKITVGILTEQPHS